MPFNRLGIPAKDKMGLQYQEHDVMIDFEDFVTDPFDSPHDFRQRAAPVMAVMDEVKSEIIREDEELHVTHPNCVSDAQGICDSPDQGSK